MIHIGINLASQPFRRDRPVLVGGAVLSAVLVGLLVLLITIEVKGRSRLTDTRAAIAAFGKQVAALSGEQARLDTVLRRPENAEVLERSLFLNALLYRKGISWTRIFADLEKIMPYNVRVISIQPQVYERDQVYLNMVVGAESPAPVVDLLKNLESSEAFGATYPHSSLPPSQNDPLFRYRLSVSYAQKF